MYGGSGNAMKRSAFLVAFLFALTGCQLSLRQELGGAVAKNECERASDCGAGRCVNRMCLAVEDGAFDTLLLSITPPTDVPGVGGVRYLSVQTGLRKTNQDFQLEVPRVSTLTGFFTPTDPACEPAALPTIPVEITFTASESSFGLPSFSHIASTGDPARPTGPCSNPDLGLSGSIREFVVNVPAGSYDVYVRPLTDAGTASGANGATCRYVPALIRDFSVAEEPAQCRPLTLAAPETLSFVIQPPTGGTLDGWTVDMVHPVTANRISNVLELDPASADGSYTATLSFSRDATLRAGKEILRITPPRAVIAPTLHFEMSALLATSVAATPPLGLFPDPEVLEAWVWSAKDFDANREVPVPGRVTFTARKLLGVADGVVASFSTTAESDGKEPVRATLLPGTYRAHFEPQLGLGYAAYETEIEVPCERDPVTPGQCLPGSGTLSPTAAPISGRVLLVPKAASIAGSVSDAVYGDGIHGASVEVAPAVLAGPRCEVDAGECVSRPLHLFDTLLGQDAFVPRSASALSDHGAFVLPEVDCGACVAGSGAAFDLTASPPDGSRLPWLVHPSVNVDVGRVDLGSRKASLPVVQWGTVQILQAAAAPIPRALIQAYLMRDQNGNPVTEVNAPSCSAPGVTIGSQNAQCVRSVLQIGEARGGEDGSFELILPSSFDDAS